MPLAGPLHVGVVSAVGGSGVVPSQYCSLRKIFTPSPSQSAVIPSAAQASVFGATWQQISLLNGSAHGAEDTPSALPPSWPPMLTPSSVVGSAVLVPVPPLSDE